MAKAAQIGQRVLTGYGAGVVSKAYSDGAYVTLDTADFLIDRTIGKTVWISKSQMIGL